MPSNDTSTTITIAVTVNGRSVSESVPANMLLSAFLRERLGLTGTHIGCDTSQCGACHVHVDGRCVKSCAMLAVRADGAEVITVEGLGSETALHPMQAAFKEHHALQCGFCTPGMVLTAAGLLKGNPNPTDAEIVAAMNGNICRCCGYPKIIAAVRRAANAKKGSEVKTS